MLVSEKTGFKTTSPIVLIYENGMPFYARNIDTNGLKFNLPAGEYDVKKGDLDQCETVEYRLMTLAEPKHFTPFPKNMELVWEANPHKCQIDVYRNKIYADPVFKTLPKYVFKWVYGHELGHFCYKSFPWSSKEQREQAEKDCDIFSGNLLLTEGFNPSQIRSAIDLAISNRLSSLCRKLNVLDKLKDIEQWK